MLLRIDHLVIAVSDPDAAVEQLAANLALHPGGGGEHPKWGTRNRLIWLGDTFIELLGVVDGELAATSWLGAPAIAALRHGPALVGWAIATDDLDADAALLRAAGAELAEPTAGERRRPDGVIVRWRLALPDAIDLERPFLIEHDPVSAEWTAADRGARAAAPGRLLELRLPIKRIHGLTTGASDRAVDLGPQRVWTHGFGDPILHLSGLGPPRRASMLGCIWSMT